MLEKIISGGQTGSDRAGLIAAKNCGLKTGGYIPKGFKTELGSEPQLAKEFGLIEFGSTYPHRTLANVQQADATWVFYHGSLERGSALTVKYCKEMGKHYEAIRVDTPGISDKLLVENLVAWLYEVKPKVLNIAGNRESVCPGIQSYVEKILTEVFRKI
jgi:hypothetical protein